METPPAPPVDPALEADVRPPGAWRGDALLWLCFVLLYALTSATTLQGTDSNEWLGIMLHGGIPHPPGYPLYALLLRAWGLLPLPVGIPFKGALLSSVVMASAVLLLARALEERNGHVFTTRLVAVAFGLCVPVWRLAGLAEVTAPLVFNAALLLWVVHYVENEDLLRPWHGAALGAALGMGVCLHHSLVLMAPLLLWHVGRAHLEAGFRRWAVAVLTGVVAGTLVVASCWGAWLLWPSDVSVPSWTHITSLQGWWDHVLRRDYGTLSSNQRAGGWSILPSLDVGLDLLRGYHVLIPLGLAALQVKRGWATFGCVLLAGLWLPGMFTSVDAHGQTVPVPLEYRERFHPLALLLFAPMVHDALASLAYQAPRLRRTVFIRIQLLLVLGIMGISGAARLVDASWRGEDATQQVFASVLQSLPPGAVVVLGGDTWSQGFAVAEEMLGAVDPTRVVLRFPRAMAGLDPDLRGRALVQQACGVLPCLGDDAARALNTLSATRPVFLFPPALREQVPGLSFSTHGLLLQVTPTPPTPADQARALEEWMQKQKLPSPQDDPRRFQEGHARAVWAMPWVALRDLARARGDDATAQHADELSRRILGATMAH